MPFFLSFLNRHHHTTANASSATNNTTMTTHTNTTNTTKHRQTQTHHPFPAQGGPLHSKSVFDTNKFGQTGNEPKYRHSDSLASRSRVCRERESPTGRVIIVIVAERGERRQEREERREREKRREKEREKRTSPPLPHPPTHPTTNTTPSPLPSPPCVGSKRLRV